MKLEDFIIGVVEEDGIKYNYVKLPPIVNSIKEEFEVLAKEVKGNWKNQYNDEFSYI